MLKYNIVRPLLVLFPVASSKSVFFHVFGVIFTFHLVFGIGTIPNLTIFLCHWPVMLIHMRVFYVVNGS